MSCIRPLLRLVSVRGLGPIRIARLLETFDTPARVQHASVNQLMQAEGIGASLARTIHQEVNVDDGFVDEELARVEQAGVSLCSIYDPAYPPLLKMIQDPPPILYIKGEILPTDQMALGIVGSRKCSGYGREQSHRFAVGLAQAGFTNVSGGARGIDTAAHEGAIRMQGRTIVVLGCGLSTVYPPENADLFDRVADGQGAVVSEFPMTTPPNAENFPRRNRIISGMSLGTIVIEASTRSGALITARLACEDHNREVMVLPGRVDSPTSAGCLRILKEGWGQLVTSAADAIEAIEASGAQHLLQAAVASDAETNADDGDDSNLPLLQQDAARSSSNLPDNSINENNLSVKLHGLTDSQRQVYEALDPTNPTELEDIATQTNLGIATLQADVTILQLRGLATRSTATGISRA